MSSEQNKAIARRIPIEVFSQGRLEVLDELLAPDFTEHSQLPPAFPAVAKASRPSHRRCAKDSQTSTTASIFRSPRATSWLPI